jgi:hypothetical protein
MIYPGLLVRLEIADFGMATAQMFLDLANSNLGLISTTFPRVA